MTQEAQAESAAEQVLNAACQATREARKRADAVYRSESAPIIKAGDSELADVDRQTAERLRKERDTLEAAKRLRDRVVGDANAAFRSAQLTAAANTRAAKAWREAQIGATSRETSSKLEPLQLARRRTMAPFNEAEKKARDEYFAAARAAKEGGG